jgi:hypothetical protein
MAGAKGDAVVEEVATRTATPVYGVFSAVYPLIELYAAYTAFQQTCSAAWTKCDAPVTEQHYFAYPPSALHCTVQTFHPFTVPIPGSKNAILDAWHPIASQASRDIEWPVSDRVRVVAARLE